MNRVSTLVIGPTPTPRPSALDSNPHAAATEAAVSGRRSDASIPGIGLILRDPRALEMALERVVQASTPILTATDDVSGLRLIEANHLALVVVDLWLSHGPGLDVLRACSHRVPAILLSEFASPDLHAEAAALGVVDVIVAPYRPADVVRRIATILGPRQTSATTTRDDAVAAALTVKTVRRAGEARHVHQ